MSSEKAVHNIDNVDIVRRLVESVELCKRKEFILSVDENQCTALHRAAEKEKTDVVEYLCSLSIADELILEKDADGWTALHYTKNREIAKLLVDSVLPENQNAFTLCADEDHCTALHIAAGISKTDIVEYFCIACL